MATQNKTRNIKPFSIILALVGVVVSSISLIGDRDIRSWLAFVLLLMTLIVLYVFYKREILKDKIIAFDEDHKLTNYVGKTIKDSSVHSFTYYGDFNYLILNTIEENILPSDNSKKIDVIIVGEKNINHISPIIKKLIDRNCHNHNVHFSYKHSSKTNVFNYLLIKYKGNEKKHLILFFKIQSTFYGYKIVIREDIQPFWERLLSDSVSVSLRDQLISIDNFSKNLAELKKPIYKGFFEHIIPPIDDDRIREIWQKSILESFNRYGISILHRKDEILDNIKITWNITEYSIADLEEFKEWLSELKKAASERLNIERYILVDLNEFKNNAEYKNLACNIIGTYFNDTAYRYYFIDSYYLGDVDYKNDYSVFKFKNDDKIVQGAIVEDTIGSRLLKVYFSKEFDDIKRIEELFGFLDNGLEAIHKSDSFDDLLSKKGLKKCI